MANQQDSTRYDEALLDFKKFSQQLKEIIDILKCENEVELFYDSENIRDFEEQLKGLNEDHISPQSVFASLLSNARYIHGVKFRDRYLVCNFPENNTVLDSNTKLIVKMVEDTLLSQSQTSETQQKYLLLNFTDLCATRAFLPIIKDNGSDNFLERQLRRCKRLIRPDSIKLNWAAGLS
jgi:hypothetical protein